MGAFLLENIMAFTAQQLDNFLKYETVRKSGKYNMWDMRAIQESGLTQEEYFFVMKHYLQLRGQAQVSPC